MTIAFIDPQRRLSIADSRGVRCLAPEAAWAGWSAPRVEPSLWSWPTWSPDGRQIASFRVGAPSEATGVDADPKTLSVRAAHVHVVDRSGVQGAELARLDDRLPIYLQWSQDGSRLAALSQREEKLILSSVGLTGGGEHILADGSPLFLTWCGTQLAAYVGGGSLGARMLLLDPQRPQSEVLLPGVPGNFCAPLWMQGRVVYVARHQGQTALFSILPEDPEPRPLEAIDGLVALLASPDGRTIARAIAPQGDGTPYRHLGLIDVETGELTPVLEQDCLAYFWIPTGQGLLACRVDTQRNLLVWQRIDRRGQVDTVFEMTPTRDLGFYLRFFEQYAQSHRIVSPHGEHLLVAGALPNEKSNENPTLWQVRLRDGRAEPVAHGVFGVYAPESEEPCLSDEH